jgi:hypothetical protein
MVFAGKQVPELLPDNSDEEYRKFCDSEDDFRRSDSDIHPNVEDSWEVCDAGNHTCVARGNTNSVLSDDLQVYGER